MKKARITLGVVFCIFILCSLTYQPIVADDMVGLSLNVKEESYNNKFDTIDTRNVINFLLRRQTEKNDCGCVDESKGIWPFPVICSILIIFVTMGIIIFLMIHDLHFLNFFLDIGENLDCYWYP